MKVALDTNILTCSEDVKGDRSRTNARDDLLAWRDSSAVVETSPEVVLIAADLATDHRFCIWDAVVLSAASRAGCFCPKTCKTASHGVE